VYKVDNKTEMCNILNCGIFSYYTYNKNGISSHKTEGRRRNACTNDAKIHLINGITFALYQQINDRL